MGYDITISSIERLPKASTRFRYQFARVFVNEVYAGEGARFLARVHARRGQFNSELELDVLRGDTFTGVQKEALVELAAAYLLEEGGATRPCNRHNRAANIVECRTFTIGCKEQAERGERW